MKKGSNIFVISITPKIEYHDDKVYEPSDTHEKGSTQHEDETFIRHSRK